MAQNDADWWERAAKWSVQNPGQPLDARQVTAHGAPPEQYRYLLDIESKPYQPAGWGEWRPEYKMEDYQAALHGDWQTANALAAQDFERRFGSLENYRKALGDFQAQGRADLEAGYSDTMKGWRQTAAEVSKQAEAAAGYGIGQFQSALDQIRGSFASLKTGAMDFVGETWDRSKQALGEFRNQIDNQMTSWVTGHQEQTDQAKKDRAARLREQGYSGDEIEAEMRKMDLDATREQGRQLANFSVAEEENYRQLQFGYNQLGTQAETAMRQLVGQAAQVKWGQEAGIANLKRQAAQWATSVSSAAKLGAEEAATNLRMNINQFKSAYDLMAANGYGQYAAMQQELGSVFSPWSSVVSNTIAAEMNLQSWHYGWQAGGEELSLAGLSVLSGASNQATSGLARWGAYE